MGVSQHVKGCEGNDGQHNSEVMLVDSHDNLVEDIAYYREAGPAVKSSSRRCALADTPPFWTSSKMPGLTSEHVSSQNGPCLHVEVSQLTVPQPPKNTPEFEESVRSALESNLVENELMSTPLSSSTIVVPNTSEDEFGPTSGRRPSDRVYVTPGMRRKAKPIQDESIGDTTNKETPTFRGGPNDSSRNTPVTVNTKATAKTENRMQKEAAVTGVPYHREELKKSITEKSLPATLPNRTERKSVSDTPTERKSVSGGRDTDKLQKCHIVHVQPQRPLRRARICPLSIVP